MGIDIALQGRFTSKVHTGGHAAAEAIQNLAELWWGDDLLDLHVQSGGPNTQIYLTTHPTAQPIEIEISRKTLEVAARTNTAGPGYHQRVCEFLHHLEAAAGIEWESDPVQDDTGYFASGNREELEEAMLGWLGGLCSAILENMEGSDTDGIGLCMPMEPQFHYPAQVRTPMGPRTLDWVGKVAAQPELGREFFASWHGDRSAGELLARAKAHMWMDVHWVPPQNEAVEATMNNVADLLAEAYRNDPSLDYPWAEWAEILGCLEHEDDALGPVVRKQAEGQTPVIGYHRHSVTFSDLPGPWHMTLPGRFASEGEDAEMWLATDGADVVSVSTMVFSGPAEPPLPREALDAEPEQIIDEWSEDGQSGTTTLVQEEEDGEQYWLVRSIIVCGRQLAHMSIETDDPHQGWIVEAARSLRAEEAGDGDEPQE